jgi:hypothetical protein
LKKEKTCFGFGRNVFFTRLYYGFAIAKDASAIWVLFGLYGLFMGITEGVLKAFLATIPLISKRPPLASMPPP